MLPGAETFLNALRILSSDRPLALGFGGMLYGRIPYLSIERYATRLGIDDALEFDRFRRIVSKIDADEVAHLNEKANKKP